MKYVIVTGIYKNSFQVEVNEYLNEGWELVGGLVIGMVGQTTYYHQAMILNRWTKQLETLEAEKENRDKQLDFLIEQANNKLRVNGTT